MTLGQIFNFQKVYVENGQMKLSISSGFNTTEPDFIINKENVNSVKTLNLIIKNFEKAAFPITSHSPHAENGVVPDECIVGIFFR